MRFGPILVPSAIAVAIGVIVAAEAGWLDGGNPDPAVIRADAGIHGSAPRQAEAIVPVHAADMPMSTGRSVGKQAASADLAANGAGGAGLDSDGVAQPATPATAALEPPTNDAVQEARDEAAKAKQDVLDVTRAALESQKASEAEFERQKSELNDRISQLQTKLDAAGKDGDAPAPGQRADAVAQAEARAATATAELGDARRRENALRTQLAALQAASATPTANADEAGSRAAVQQALQQAEARAKDADTKVAALQKELAADKAAGAKAEAATETARAEGGARIKMLEDRIKALDSAAAMRDAAVKRLSADAESAKPLAADLSAAHRSIADLEAKVATLRSAASTDSAAHTTDARTIATLRTELDASRQREHDLDTRIAAGQSEAARVATLPTAADGPDLARLQDDLSGARRGEATLRKENVVLQRELAEARAAAVRLRDDADDQTARAPAAAPQAVRRGSARRAEGVRDIDRAAARPARAAQAATRPVPGADDQRAVIQRATALIRAGRIDQARQMLRAANSPATTRALADTYNPLTNTKYGAIGVDSDAERASFLYQQAARPF